MYHIPSIPDYGSVADQLVPPIVEISPEAIKAYEAKGFRIDKDLPRVWDDMKPAVECQIQSLQRIVRAIEYRINTLRNEVEVGEFID